MKKSLFLIIPMILAASAAHAGRVNVDLGIHIGNPYPPAVVVTQPPVVVTRQPVVVSQPPVVVAGPGYWHSPGLGVHVSLGGPYDMFWFRGTYYRHQHNGWLAAPSVQGPWRTLQHRHLPPGLANKKYHDIVRIRDIDYRHYQQRHPGYRKYDDNKYSRERYVHKYDDKKHSRERYAHKYDNKKHSRERYAHR